MKTYEQRVQEYEKEMCRSDAQGVVDAEDLKAKNKKGFPVLNYGQVRNQCWNCENYFSIEKNYLIEKQRGQKQYIICNFCRKINHL